MQSLTTSTNSAVPDTQPLAEVYVEMQTLFRDGQKSRIKKDQPVEVTKAYAKAGVSSSKPFLRYYLFTYPQNYEIILILIFGVYHPINVLVSAVFFQAKNFVLRAGFVISCTRWLSVQVGAD